MSKKYTSEAIDALVLELGESTALIDKKKSISTFYETYLVDDLPKEYVKNAAHEYVGTLLFKLFIIMNVLVLGIIILFIGIDLTFHIDDAENRFISGGILTTFMTTTVAQAFAGYFSFTKFINGKNPT